MISRLFKICYLALPLLINLIFISILHYLLKGGILVLIDSPLTISKIEANKNFLNLWNMNSFGYANLGEVMAFYQRLVYYFLLNLGLSAKLTQLIAYFTFLSVIFYSSWAFFNKLLKTLGYSRSLNSSFWGSFFYTYNLMMVSIWSGGIGETVFVLLISLPIILYIFSSIIISGYSKKNIISLGVIIGLNYTYIPMTLALLIVFFTSLLIVKKGSKVKEIISIIATGVTSIVVGFGFLLPQLFLYLGIDVFSRVNPADSYISTDLGIRGIFRFFFDWTIKMNGIGTYRFPLYPYYNNPFIIVSSYIIWIICVYYLIQEIKNKTSNVRSVFLFILTALVVGIFFDKGFQPPFQNIFEFFYRHVPLSGVFRTPYSKFNYPIIILISFLAALSLAQSKNRFMKICLIICILLQTLPFFSGSALIGVKANKRYQNIVIIPKQYDQIANTVNSDSTSGYMLMYPGSLGGTFDYKNGYGLTGQDILGQLIKRPIIYSDNGVFYTKSREKYAQIIKQIDTYDLSKNNIRYVFVREDLSYGGMPTLKDIELFKKKINANVLLKKIYTSSLGSLYIVPPQKYNGLLSLVVDNKTYDLQISKSILGYTIHIPRRVLVDGQNIYFQVNNSYDPLWVLNSKDPHISITKHHLLDNYGNQWKITINQNSDLPNSTDKIEFTLHYKLQQYYIFGLIFSSCLALVLFIFYLSLT